MKEWIKEQQRRYLDEPRLKELTEVMKQTRVLVRKKEYRKLTELVRRYRKSEDVITQVSCLLSASYLFPTPEKTAETARSELMEALKDTYFMEKNGSRLMDIRPEEAVPVHRMLAMYTFMQDVYSKENPESKQERPSPQEVRSSVRILDFHRKESDMWELCNLAVHLMPPSRYVALRYGLADDYDRLDRLHRSGPEPAYDEGVAVLQDVSFTIPKGSTFAILGGTGSGKSTILSLICRNYEFQKGEILIDGIDIRKIKISSLRRHFGQMLQDVFLFSGTIRSNIVLREDNISDEEIMQVCRYVNADHFINKLDHGLDEEVRERGNNFSAGQRQLLSFARTIIHKPSVMILDEATANIDTETELLIQDSLEKMRTVGTMLIVAHRLSTIQHADNIIVLSHGKILEQGSHQELLARHGRYYQLYTLQYHKEQLSS